MNHERELDLIHEKLSRLEQKVDLLISFRFVLIGAAATVSALISVGIQLLK